MRTYKLTIFRQGRFYFGFLLMPFALIGFLILGAELNSIALGGLFFCLFLLTWFFYAIGHLKVTIDDDQLHFQFTRKLLFNYRPIPPVRISDITTIVIDNGDLFRKIIIRDRIIYLNTTKFKQHDIHKFIYNLETLTKPYGVRRMNSWGEWKEKGYLRAAYIVNNIVVIFGVVAVVYSIVLKGFFAGQLFFILLLVPKLLFFGQQMKQELNSDK